MRPSIESAVPPADAGTPSGSPGSGAGPAPDGGETAAWAEVLGAWEDEARHRAYLARFPDLEGLAVAGGRYRAALAARPDDPIAARFREEVLRRATAQAFAAMPAPAAPARSRAAVRVAAVVVIVLLALAAALAALRLGVALGARP